MARRAALLLLSVFSSSCAGQDTEGSSRRFLQDYHSPQLECDDVAMIATACIDGGIAICNRKMRYLEIDTVEQRASECSCPELTDDTDTDCQVKIDMMYDKCDGQTRDSVTWDETKISVKNLAEQSACSMASRQTVGAAAAGLVALSLLLGC